MYKRNIDLMDIKAPTKRGSLSEEELKAHAGQARLMGENGQDIWVTRAGKTDEEVIAAVAQDMQDTIPGR